VKSRIVILLLILSGIPYSYSQVPLSKDQLKESSTRAEKFLKTIQLPHGAISDSSNTLFNIWETIIATDALISGNSINDSTVQRALIWLQNNENSNGLVCHNVNCKQDYCVETSALYLKLIAQDSSTLNLLERLKFLSDHQNEDGSWSVGNPDVLFEQKYPSVTGFVINLFENLNVELPKSNEAYNFLSQQQKSDGSWGKSWEYYGCSAYAIWQCVPAMKSCKECEKSYSLAKHFILNSQLEDGSWNDVTDSTKNHVSKQLQTAFMLSALTNETDSLSRIAFSKGIYFLLSSQQENGSWDGGYFPIPNQRYKKAEYVVATSLIYKLLLDELKKRVDE